MSDVELGGRTRQKLERLCKWRSVFTGWQLGTRPASDPETQAIRSSSEARLLMRAELSALTGLLIKKGIITEDEFAQALGDEADLLCADLEKLFPGMAATDEGMRYDSRAAETMKGWKP